MCLLTSCSYEVVFEPYDFSHEFIKTKYEQDLDSVYKNEDYATLTWKDRNNKINLIDEYRDVFSSKTSTNPQALKVSPSVGEIKALIIPVQFLDSDTSNSKEKLITIQNAFLGSEKQNSFLSISEYYYRSSYGQLKLTGTVTPFFTYNKTADSLINSQNSIGESRRIAATALDWYYKNHPDFDMSIYDLDGDKYLDAFYLVYDFPYNIPGNNNDLFWAYVDHTYRGEGKPNEIRNDHEICVANYAWISYEFFKSDTSALPETHTAIHESGHIFGLEDYYNTSTNGVYQPTGFMDMMDCNLGDHTAFSKMLLNWVTPYVLKGEGEVTLRPFAETGDFLLVPSSKGWNSTPYDEYLLLEFFTPTGLNKYDAGKTYRYINSQGKEGSFTYFSEYGLKVYHVDARLGLFESKNSGNPFVLLDDPNIDQKIQNFKDSKSSDYCVDFAFNNSPFNDTDNVLYHLLEKSGNNSFINGKPANNNTLFYENDSFGINTYIDFSFNNGAELDYTFRVTKVSKTEIKITFSQK